jgi:hypothetical protein
VRKLTSTDTNPHFSSLPFIYSAGAWDRDSRRLAIATIVSGRPTLSIFDVASGEVEHEFPVPTVDEIFNPSWAPDGHAIAFTGMSQGLTDLYTYNLTTSSVRRLTNDAYAEIQPAWSPDGRRIAFATDRFSTDLPVLAIGGYALGLVGAESGTIEAVPAFPKASHLDPQWSPDGRVLYFVSNPHGIFSLFRLALATGDVTAITDVATGLSGITGSSPAMSIATRTGHAAFSVYQGGTYSIYVIDIAAGGPSNPIPPLNAAVLPPTDRRPSDVAALPASVHLDLDSLRLGDGGRYCSGYAAPVSTMGWPCSQMLASVRTTSVGEAAPACVTTSFSDSTPRR